MAISYIDQLNSFHTWLLSNRISASARLLWYSLLHINNSTGWKSVFNVSMEVLKADTGMSESAIKRARNVLQQAGLINFTARPGRLSTVYSIERLKGIAELRIEPQGERLTGRLSERLPERLTGRQSERIHKVEESRVEESRNTTAATVVTGTPDSEFAEVTTFYRKNVHDFSGPVEAEMLGDLVDTYGAKWTKSAIREAIATGHLSMSYINGVLRNWKAVGGPEAAKQLHAQRKAGSVNTGKPSLADEAKRILASWEARDTAAGKEALAHGTG